MTTKDAPKYQFIFDELLFSLNRGLYKQGDRFVTEKEICDKYSTSRMTAVRVLKMFEDKNLVQRRQGSGSFVKADLSAPLTAGDTVAFVMQTMKYLHPFIEALNIKYDKAGINLKLIIGDYNNNDEFLHFANPAYKRIIFNPSWEENDILSVYPEKLAQYSSKLIVISKRIEGFSGYNIYPSEVEMGRIIARHFINKGRKNIGFFCSYKEQYHFKLRQKGLAEEAKSNGITFNSLFVCSGLEAVGEIKQWIVKNNIDSIAVGQHNEALLLKNVLDAIGFSVPGDIQLAAFANDGSADNVGFPLPYLDRQYEQMAETVFRVTTTSSNEEHIIKMDTPLKMNTSKEIFTRGDDI